MGIFPIFITEQNGDRANTLNLQIGWIDFFRAQNNLYCSLTDGMFRILMTSSFLGKEQLHKEALKSGRLIE